MECQSANRPSGSGCNPHMEWAVKFSKQFVNPSRTPSGTWCSVNINNTELLPFGIVLIVVNIRVERSGIQDVKNLDSAIADASVGFTIPRP